ncbi:MAG: hypothetical protein QM658_17640 [Gordonia sp. (in: high G+C Gram-positive bacteria)]
MLHWRAWLTDEPTGDWLDGRAYYRARFIDYSIDNPDQRIQSDIDVFTTGVGPETNTRATGPRVRCCSAPSPSPSSPSPKSCGTSPGPDPDRHYHPPGDVLVRLRLRRDRHGHRACIAARSSGWRSTTRQRLLLLLPVRLRDWPNPWPSIAARPPNSAALALRPDRRQLQDTLPGCRVSRAGTWRSASSPRRSWAIQAPRLLPAR